MNTNKFIIIFSFIKRWELNLKHPKVQLNELGLLLYKIKIIIINSIRTAGKNKNMSFLNKTFFFFKKEQFFSKSNPSSNISIKKSAMSDFELSNSSWSTNSSDNQKKKKTFFHQ